MSSCRKIPITLTENCLRSKERTPRVTVFPNLWDKLGMAAIDCKKVHQQNPRSALTKDHHSATLLIARRLIEQGFHDALAVGRDGRPTESALESWEWLTARTDWTRHNRAIPPPELRQQFYGSFEWCCRWLDEDPERIRTQGLTPTHGIGSSQGRETWSGERIQGLPDVQRRWTIAASRLRPY